MNLLFRKEVVDQVKGKFHSVKFIKNLGETFEFSIKASLLSSPKYFWLRVFLNLFSAAASFIAVFLFSRLADLFASRGSAAESLYLLIFLIVLIFAVRVINRLTGIISAYCERMHQEILTQHIQKNIIRKAAEVDLSFFDSTDSYNNLYNVQSNISLFSRVDFQAANLMKALVQAASAFCCLASFNPVDAALLAVFGVFSAVYNIWILKKGCAGEQKDKSHRHRISCISDMTMQKHYAKDIRMYGMSSFILNKYDALFGEWLENKRKASLKSTIALCLAAILPELITALIILRLGWIMSVENFGVGSLVCFTGLVPLLFSSITMAVYATEDLNKAGEKLQVYPKLMQWRNKLEDSGSRQVPEGPLTVEFCNVSFSYTENGHKALEHVSFQFHSGEKVVLTGENGSGKTTIIKLLLRFYDPDEGEIRLNGINLKEYDLKSLRKVYSVMFQDCCHYPLTIREAVEIADLESAGQSNRLDKAVQHSGADTFIRAFPKGLDTYLTKEYEKDGEKLSGAQWQKLALARTIYREADFYILDKTSAALDEQSENELFSGFERLYPNKGIILVAHHLSNITHMDKILLLEKGRLIEQGTHKALMDLNGKYAKIFQAQTEITGRSF